MARSILTLLPVFPFDRAGGAQRSMDGIARLLATTGWRSSVLATTLSDAPDARADEARSVLRERGARVHDDRSGPLPVLRFRDAGVDYTLLEIPPARRSAWSLDDEAAMDALLSISLRTVKPDIVHTYGAAPRERARHAMSRAAGAAVVLGVRTHAYYHRGAYEHVDAVLTTTAFMVEQLRQRVGTPATPIMMPMEWDQIVAPAREPIFTVYVNPSADKGVLFFARLADELAKRRPDIPLLVFEARAGAGALFAAGVAGGIDLRVHPSIMISPGVAQPRDLFAAARILLVPSAWAEPAGRVIAEAMINGVPALYADRGGMHEVAGGSGRMLPLPPTYTEQSTEMPSIEAVQPWIDAIIDLCDHDDKYQAESAKSRAAAEAFRPEVLAAEYDAFFRAV